MITQTQIFESLKVKLGASRQISDRTINDTLETLMSFVTEETDLAVFTDLIAPTFVSMDGNLRHEVAEKAKAIEDAKKAATKTPEQIAAEAAAEAAKAGEPEWFKAYRESSEQKLTDLQKKFDGVEAAKTIAQKRDEIFGKLKTKYTNELIQVAAKNFDFSKDTAEAEFDAACVEIGSLLGVKPIVGDVTKINSDAAAFAAQKADLQAKGIIPKD
jgi:hypothetical protein